MRTRFSKEEKRKIKSIILHALDILASDYSTSDRDDQEFKNREIEINSDIELAEIWINKMLPEEKIR